MIDKITNKDYIEITANSVTVGGVPATTYRGQEIWCVEDLPNDFKEIQQIVQREYGAAPIAMRVMSSETNGEYAKPGNPSPKHGKNAWVSFVFANGIETRWVFRNSFLSASGCAGGCADGCGNFVRVLSDFRSGVFGPHADAIKKLANKSQVSDVSAVNKSGDTTIAIDLGNQILQLQIHASLILKSNSK